MSPQYKVSNVRLTYGGVEIKGVGFREIVYRPDVAEVPEAATPAGRWQQAWTAAHRKLKKLVEGTA